jgi:hypothetical protein
MRSSAAADALAAAALLLLLCFLLTGSQAALKGDDMKRGKLQLSSADVQAKLL